LTSFDCN